MKMPRFIISIYKNHGGADGNCYANPRFLLLPTIDIEQKKKLHARAKLDDGTPVAMCSPGVAFSLWWLVWQFEIMVFPRKWNR